MSYIPSTPSNITMSHAQPRASAPLTSHNTPHATDRCGHRLARFALALSLMVIILGAYTRLTNAGLGCPDWPGCYGQLTVPQTSQHIANAKERFPDRPIEHAKAWAEMTHRYVAGTLGVLICCLCVIHFKNSSAHRFLSTALVTLVVAQAALGMWTVTLGLKPIIVVAHLLGGFATFSLLLTLCLRQTTRFFAPPPGQQARRHNRLFQPLIAFALAVLIVQIALGGWTAANYAATACTELPICQAHWTEHFTLTEALTLWGHDVAPYAGGASTYEYAQHITPDVKVTIHVLHRFGAIATTVLLLLCVTRLWRANSTLAHGLLILVALQVGLGITNVLALLPLSIAILHNLVAALLLGWMIFTLMWISQQTRAHSLATDNLAPASS